MERSINIPAGAVRKGRLITLPPLELERVMGGIESSLSVLHIRKDRLRIDYGVLGRKMITTLFVNELVDAMQNTGTLGYYKYHGSGTDNTGEAVGDTECGALVGTDYTLGNQGEGATANIYKSVGTIAYTSTKTIAEHVIANAADPASAIVGDRTVLGATVGVVDGDSIQFTYQLTFTAGS